MSALDLSILILIAPITLLTIVFVCGNFIHKIYCYSPNCIFNKKDKVDSPDRVNNSDTDDNQDHHCDLSSDCEDSSSDKSDIEEVE